jgi:hypothetical protein
MSEDENKPATKIDLEKGLIEMRNFILDRESALIWKVLALQFALIGALAGANWAIFFFVLQHWV